MDKRDVNLDNLLGSNQLSPKQERHLRKYVEIGRLEKPMTKDVLGIRVTLTTGSPKTYYDITSRSKWRISKPRVYREILLGLIIDSQLKNIRDFELLKEKSKDLLTHLGLTNQKESSVLNIKYQVPINWYNYRINISREELYKTNVSNLYSFWSKSLWGIQQIE